MRYFNLQTAENIQVRISRIATVLIGLVSVVLGLLISYSADWLRQSVVEASTIFNAFDAIILPAFLFAVLSKRASTLLVWFTAGSLWGLKFGMITWYFFSTAAIKHWEPGLDPGLAGPFSAAYALPFIIIGLILLPVWAMMKYRQIRFSTLVLLASTMNLGYGAGLLIWSLFSNLYCQETAKALSFQWLALPSIVCYVVIGIIWLSFGKVQKKEKYQGLTLFDKGDVIMETK